MLAFVGRTLFGSVAGALIRPLVALTLIPVVMGAFSSCTGAKAELRRTNAAHRQTVKRIDALATESNRLKTLADAERARAEANKKWALQEEQKPCPDSCLLPE